MGVIRYMGAQLISCAVAEAAATCTAGKIEETLNVVYTQDMVLLLLGAFCGAEDYCSTFRPTIALPADGAPRLRK